MKKLLALLLTLCFALVLVPGMASAAGDGWQFADGGWRYFENGEMLTGVRWIETEGGRYIFDANGFLQVGDAEGDVLCNGNLYYINPQRDLDDPRSCYAVRNYTRSRPEVGLTYYDGDGITFVGWISAGDGKLMYQTCVPKENVPGAAKDVYIYVWRAQYILEGENPLTGERIPAAWYLFGDDGVLITEPGEHACGDGNTYYVNEKGRIVEKPYFDPTAQDQSGLENMAKLSKEEISELLQSNPDMQPDVLFDVAPHCSAPYAAGKVTDALLQSAANRLNALRRIAGLSAVTLDAEMCETAQYGAVLMARLGAISHTPQRPEDMPEDFYTRGARAAGSSNLYAGVTLTRSVDGFMDDSDRSNVSHLGHRRWQLNPAMAKIGFGYVYEPASRYRNYVTEMCMDKSGGADGYDFVAWPASGNFPGNIRMFTSNTAWSVTLNPARYQKPDQNQITVTLTRKSDGRTWTFYGENYSAEDDAYFNVNNVGYGVSNCIIFRPDGITQYEGIYNVRINGLQKTDGTSATLSYWVDFFDA